MEHTKETSTQFEEKIFCLADFNLAIFSRRWGVFCDNTIFEQAMIKLWNDYALEQMAYAEFDRWDDINLDFSDEQDNEDGSWTESGMIKINFHGAEYAGKNKIGIFAYGILENGAVDTDICVGRAVFKLDDFKKELERNQYLY